ncbi:MAG: pseudouridine-5'-phosphate glycosidase [Pseudomonadota bacterium]
MSLPMHIADPVADAVAAKVPVVALESTIITHGLPAPRNLETALAVEATVRERGAVPATIAVLDGVLHIGLDGRALTTLSRAKDVLKLSRADLATALVQRATGSTTVAATMIAAHLAGIEVFATGGIGGVHQGAETSFDISADLQELSLTAVTVVAAGAKAILDVPKTLEHLETLGVPVIGYGTDIFPAFWSRDSGLPCPIRLDEPAAIAASHRMRGALGLAGGQLVANPIPLAAEIPAETMRPLIAEAQAHADATGVAGKTLTPFLLAQILELSAGRSLEANIALVLNNAALAADIAVCLSHTYPEPPIS